MGEWVKHLIDQIFIIMLNFQFGDQKAGNNEYWMNFEYGIYLDERMNAIIFRLMLWKSELIGRVGC